MSTWHEFETDAPEIAAAGRRLLTQFGPGLAFLATIRADGGPRLHPVCVNFVESDLHVLIGPSPKRGDLLRDGRFALHSFPPAEGDDEFYLTGRAIHCDDAETRRRVAAAQHASGATSSGDELDFRLDVERALYARYRPPGEPYVFPPEYFRWRSA
jgi:hypothetical protein